MGGRWTHTDDASPFATLFEVPTVSDMQLAGRVRYTLVSGRQDDGFWGTMGALWLSQDDERGGFLVHPWALGLGSEMARSYRGALARGFTALSIYSYWRDEVWIGSNVAIAHERDAESLFLLNELVGAL